MRAPLAHTSRTIIGLLVLSLVAAGCGARFSDEQRALVRSAGAGGGLAAGDPSQPGTEGFGDDFGFGTDDPGADVGDGGADDIGGGPAGPTPGPGGAGSPGPGGGATAGPQSAGCPGEGGATDVGVTADTITIGNVSILSGPIPGFARSGQRAVQAYVNYVNSRGGICGRRLQLVTADDRFDTGANRAEHERLQRSVFAFVGGQSVVDDGGAAVLAGTNIPDVGLSLSDARIRLPNNFSPAPIDLADGGNGLMPALRYFRETMGVRTGAVIWPTQAIATARAQGYIRDLERAGYQVIYTAAVSPTETNYNGHANQIKQRQADVLVTTLEINGMASLARALRQQQYQPKVAAYGAQVYGKDFLTRAGDAAEGTTLAIAHSLFEDAPNVPTVRNLLDWFRRTTPGLEPDFFSVLGWAAADMFAKAAAAVGNNLTRDAMIAQLRTMTSYDADGLIAPINPAQKKWASCFVVVTVQNGQWRRVDPASGYRC